MDCRPTPETPPVLQSQHRAARFITVQTLGRHRQVALHPLVRHDQIAVEFLDDFLADASQCGPLTVRYCFGCASLVHFEFAHFTRQSVRRDARQCFAAHLMEVNVELLIIVILGLIAQLTLQYVGRA